MSDNRYARHHLIDWLSQDAVQAAKIGVVGAGAIGNEVIKNLTLLGVGTIDIFDFDTIEVHNLTRSVLFRESDIGRTKAETAAARARELDPNVALRAFEGDFWQRLSLARLARYDALICCVDNVEARIRLNRLCHLVGTNLINCGIDSRFALCTLYPFAVATEPPCFECSLDDAGYAKAGERYSCGGLRKVAFEERKVPTTIITSAQSAAMAVNFALQFTRDEAAQSETISIFADTILGRATRSRQRKRAGCGGCGQYAGRLKTVALSPVVAEDTFAALELDAGNTVVDFSDMILTGHWSHVKGEEQTFTPVFRRASDFDDSYASQVAEVGTRIEVEIEDRFALPHLIKRFEGMVIPAKFAVIRDGQKSILADFEGDSINE